MSKKKKVVVATTSTKKRVSPTSSTRRTSSVSAPNVELTFGKQTYIWMGIGVGLITLGLLLMLGGAMENPNEWDESVIYSWRRTVLAPFIILTGLSVEIYAIFKK